MPGPRQGSLKFLVAVVAFVTVSCGPRGVSGLYLEPDVEDEEMWQEVILLSRRTPTTTPQMQVQIWPMTHPAHPPTSRMMRYLPYHPMVRFRGSTLDSRPLMNYYFEAEDRPKKNPNSSDLWQLLSHLALQKAGRYGQNLRFGFSKRR